MYKLCQLSVFAPCSSSKSKPHCVLNLNVNEKGHDYRKENNSVAKPSISRVFVLKLFVG